MAEQEQRTEQATPRKKQKLREEGRVAQSHDVTSLAAFLLTAGALAFMADTLATSVGSFAVRIFRLQDTHEPFRAIRVLVPILGQSLVPILMTAAVGAVAAGVAQTQGLFHLPLVAPKWERLDPTENIKRILPGKDVLLEMGKQLLKMLAIAFIVYNIIKDTVDDFSRLANTAPALAAMTTGAIVGKVFLQVGIAFVALAGLDYWLSYRRFEEEAKMSKQEVRDELKEEEGDPLQKRRMRKQMREAGKRRAVTDVRGATVLVTNPTHFAVALRYDPDKGDPAPMMLSKGSDEVALKMREEARKHRIPIVENRPLARSLHATGKIGQPIPVDLYKAAAEVIAHVMRLKAGGLV